MNIIPESRPVVAIEGHEAYLVVGYTLNQGKGHTVVVDSHGDVSVLTDDSRLYVLRCFETALQADVFMSDYATDPDAADAAWDVYSAGIERHIPRTA